MTSSQKYVNIKALNMPFLEYAENVQNKTPLFSKGIQKKLNIEKLKRAFTVSF